MKMNGDEEDAFKARSMYHWRPGEIRRIKRAFMKRVRREGKRQARDGLADE